jgi:hypothetical protein
LCAGQLLLNDVQQRNIAMTQQNSITPFRLAGSIILAACLGGCNSQTGGGTVTGEPVAPATTDAVELSRIPEDMKPRVRESINNNKQLTPEQKAERLKELDGG